jgi:hypothetical protein
MRAAAARKKLAAAEAKADLLLGGGVAGSTEAGPLVSLGPKGLSRFHPRRKIMHHLSHLSRLALALFTIALVAGAGRAEPKESLDQLLRQRATLQGEIDTYQSSIASFESLGRQLNAEAQECLSARPPRFSSAAMFRAQAQAAFAEAGKARMKIAQASRKLAEVNRKIAALGRGQ